MAELAINGGMPVRTGEWHKWPVVGEKELELIKQVTGSGNWSYNGPLETMLRKVWAEYIGTRYSIAAANGTVTLQLAWEALGVGFGDEVIVPALTWQATAASVLDVNAIPVLVDVEEDSWCIDPELVAAAITPRTKAIAAVHLYGTVCNMDAIMALAEKYNLFVVEDCAHQHGSVYKNRKVGSIGHIGSFSLQNSKVLTCGEGGLLTTDNFEFAEKLDALRNCGRRPVMSEMHGIDTGNYVTEGNFIQSGNYRMTEFQAAILLGQIDRLPQQIEQRDENAKYLRKRLENIQGIKMMRREEGTNVQSYFNFAFRYDSEAFDGLPVQKFREAVTAELDFPLTPCYQPLNACEIYSPLTKKRHRISDEYVSSINPERFILPAATKAYREESVCLHHKVLMGSKEDMDKITEAIVKVREHVGEMMN